MTARKGIPVLLAAALAGAVWPAAALSAGGGRRPALARAASPVTTGPATSITALSAVLTGTINPTNPDSAYSFQYGSTPTALNLHTAIQPVGAGERQVSAGVANLQPDTKYYYRLVLEQGSYPGKGYLGATLSFTTMAAPPTVATTGSASSITASSARLHGVINTTVEAGWVFQYQRPGGPIQSSAIQTIAPGVHAVSVVLRGLAPGTSYRFRLFVAQETSSGPAYGEGAFASFRTLRSAGSTHLQSTRLRVFKDRVAIALSCRGVRSAACSGRATVTIARRAGRHTHTVRCAAASFSIAGGARSTLRPRLARTCASALGRASHHRLHAKLTIRFSDGEKALRRGVVLSR
jgi:hypothetical protein